MSMDEVNKNIDMMEKRNREIKASLEIEGAKDADKILDGQTKAEPEPEKKEETDEEYTTRFERGEVNLLKGEGIL